MADILGTMHAFPIFASQKLKTRAIQLEDGMDYLHQAKDLNPESCNSGLQVLYQLGTEDILLRATVEVFSHIAKEPCFNQLRTIEQLGYIVFSSSFRSHGIEYFRVIVQSDVATPEYVDASIEKFLIQLRQDQ